LVSAVTRLLHFTHRKQSTCQRDFLSAEDIVQYHSVTGRTSEAEKARDRGLPESHDYSTASLVDQFRTTSTLNLFSRDHVYSSQLLSSRLRLRHCPPDAGSLVRLDKRGFTLQSLRFLVLVPMRIPLSTMMGCRTAGLRMPVVCRDLFTLPIHFARKGHTRRPGSSGMRCRCKGVVMDV
jgi:hypothetical protein